MKITPNLQYVEHMRNIGYLTGFVRHLGKLKNETWHSRQIPGFNGYLLQQTSNIEQAIPIHVPEGVPMPADKSPITVAVHVSGHTDSVTSEQSLKVKSIDHSRPSIRAMPASMAWSLSSNQKYANDDFNPFGKGSSLSTKIESSADDNDGEFTDSEAALQRMLVESKGKLDTRLGQNSNVVFTAGILNSFQKFMPDEHKTNSFWDLRLRQHESVDKCSPIRVYTRDMKGMGSRLKRGLPIAISGQIRVKVIPNDDKDGLLEGVVYIRTDDVNAANRVTDIKKVPSWFSKMREEREEMRERQKAAHQKAQQQAKEQNKSEAGSLLDKIQGN